MSKVPRVKYLLENQGITLPEQFLEDDFILDIENAISTRSAAQVSLFFRKVAREGLDKKLDTETMEKFFSYLKDISKEKSELFTKDDEKIIKILNSSPEPIVHKTLEMSGPLYYILQILQEIEENEDLPERISMTTMLWIFVNMYEIITYHLDRNLLNYLENLDKKTHQKLLNKGHIKRFIERVDRDGSNHATAGLINGCLSSVIDSLSQDNSSLIGSETKMIRDKISHANLFYDKEKEEVVILDGPKKYSNEEFKEEFQKMLIFVTKWIEYTSNMDTSKIKSGLKEIFNNLADMMKREKKLKTEKNFAEHVIKWEREAGIIDSKD
ncbi:MAG: hypothetical protein ABEK36_00565 [Candidatus Aenigmatarchaeota archaeon]